VSDRKDEVLRIRCNRKTLVLFKEIAAAYDNYEDALSELISFYKEFSQEYRGRYRPDSSP
jgi:hypothetical protein